MPQSTAPDIRDLLARYLAGNLALSGLGRELSSAAWGIEAGEDRDAVALLHELELGLAEHSNGDWTEDELRALFRPLLTTSSTDHSQDAW